MVKKTVSLIIPNYNGNRLLVKNLPKVFEAAKMYDSSTEIIIVDDGSTDNSIETLKTIMGPLRHDVNVKIITKEKNEGFSSTCNLGAKKANGNIIVLLNTDIWPEKDFLLYLIPHFNQAKVFGVGCLDKSLENGNEVERGRGIGWFKKGFLVHARGEVDKNNTLWASGGSSAYNRKLWLELGGFDQIYNPFYWEDIDLSYRAQKRGYAVLFEPKAVVHHEHKKGAIKSKFSEKQVKTIAYRNQFIFLWKNITDVDLFLQHLLYLPLYFLKALIRGDTPFIIGLVKALVKLPELYYYRATVCGSNTKCISDKEILAPYLNEN